MKLTNLFLIVSLIFTACSKESAYEEKYETGEIKLNGTIDESGYRIGIWNNYDIDGNLVTKYHYRMDTLYLEETYIDGSLSTKEEMLGKDKHGTTLSYYSTGELESSYEFLYGVQVGKIFSYYKTGKLKMESTYSEDGYPTGLFKQYYPNGNVNVEISDFGNGTMNYYDNSGELQMSIVFEGNIPIDTTLMLENAIEVLTEDMKVLNLPE